jgi:hypothetical protein
MDNTYHGKSLVFLAASAGVVAYWRLARCPGLGSRRKLVALIDLAVEEECLTATLDNIV